MSQTQTEKKKWIYIDAIQDMADKAGMTADELLEWGLYTVLETWDGENGDPRDVPEELEKLRESEGQICGSLIYSNPLADFADEAGISCSDLNELALLATFDMLKCSEYPNKQPRELLEDYRRNQRPLIPQVEQVQHDRVKVHPMMAALFSGDLRAVHGKTFGDNGSEHVLPEHFFIRKSLKIAFDAVDWTDTICQLMEIEPAIRYCPTLQNEAKAIRTLIEAEGVLCDFCHAVDNN